MGRCRAVVAAAAHLCGRERAGGPRRLHARDARLGRAVRARGSGSAPRARREALPPRAAAPAHARHARPRLPRRSALSAGRRRGRARHQRAGRAAAVRACSNASTARCSSRTRRTPRRCRWSVARCRSTPTGGQGPLVNDRTRTARDAGRYCRRVDEHGTVRARARRRRRRPIPGPRRRRSARSGVKATPAQVRRTSAWPSTTPESASIRRAVAKLGLRYRARSRTGGRQFLSGTAAATAEAWVGAACDIKDMVFFAVSQHEISSAWCTTAPRCPRRVIRAAPAGGSVAWHTLNPVEREGLSQDRMSRSRSRGRRHRPPPDLADQGGRSVAVQEMVKDGTWLRDHRRAYARSRARNSDNCRSRRPRRGEISRHGRGQASSSSPIGMLVLGGIMASAADLLLEPIRTEVARGACRGR